LGRRSWPRWWNWDLELSPHVLKRMEDRGFTEVDLRRMLEHAMGLREDLEQGRWVIVTRRRRQRWEVIVEPDAGTESLVVITAYPLAGT
jgi:ribosomal protein L34